MYYAALCPLEKRPFGGKHCVPDGQGENHQKAVCPRDKAYRRFPQNLFVYVKVALEKAVFCFIMASKGSNNVPFSNFCNFMGQLLSKSLCFLSCLFLRCLFFRCFKLRRIERTFPVWQACRVPYPVFQCFGVFCKVITVPRLLPFLQFRSGRGVVYLPVNHVIVLLGGLFGSFQIIFPAAKTRHVIYPKLST